MAAHEDETRAPPGRMASAAYGPDYADVDDDLRGPAYSGTWTSPVVYDGGRNLTETKPFFVTTEFVATVAALLALAVTAASSESFDAGLAWPLATAIVAAFVFSRGFAKAAAPSSTWDPRELLRPSSDGGDSRAPAERAADATSQPAGAVPHEEEETRQMSTMSREQYGTQQYGAQPSPMYGYGRGFGMRQAFPVETKPFFLTSEFWGSLALIVALAIAGGTSDTIDARLFWTLATAITIGYVLSRGIAKSGTKSRSWDPREDLMQGARERIASRQSDGG